MKTLEKIETFLVLAQCRSFMETAKRLYCSQPTISNHIQQLEEQFQCKLFHRSGKNVQLTKQGEIFLQYAKQITQLVEEAAVKMKDAERQDILAIYVSSYIGAYFFSDILSSFHQEYPKQALEVHTHCYAELRSALQQGRTNFALMPVYPEDDYIHANFDVHVLFHDEFPLVVPPNHPLTGRKVVYSRDLRNETLLLPRSHYLQEYIITELERQRVKVRFLQMSNFDMIKQAVKSHLGLAFLPFKAVEAEVAKGELAFKNVASLPIRRNNGIVIRKQTPLTETEFTFCHEVKRYFGVQ
ncbi:LysR family transcriptional regulator [Paenibacillus sp. JMULE4]|uniref:LysR family transcriptional regulator n=1 Tax=Paenibacillus TaxID=44249 RepID=UPI0020C7424C|nr:LysR family transcriptional regulator [Paenibacillus sp. JMULE4]